MAKIFKTLLIITITIILGIIIGSMFSSKIPFIGDERIKEMELENIELKDSIKNRNKRIINLNKGYQKLKGKNKEYKEVINKNDSILSLMNTELDSINTRIKKQDTIIKNIYDERNKDISNVPNMDFDERIKFFTEYFIRRSESDER